VERRLNISETSHAEDKDVSEMTYDESDELGEWKAGTARPKFPLVGRV
jgi:hypothetical protein